MFFVPLRGQKLEVLFISGEFLIFIGVLIVCLTLHGSGGSLFLW